MPIRFQGYAYQEVFSPAELRLFESACDLVAKVPHRVLGLSVRCHELVRAVAPLLKLTFEDGFYGMLDHSWLWLKPREPLSPPPKILDVYVPGRVPQVQLVDSCTKLPWDYRRGPPRVDIDSIMVGELIRLMSEPK